jgi:hypothetical protein
VTAYTVHPGHHVTPAPEHEWAPPAPPPAPGVHQRAASPSLDTLYRVLNGLCRLDTRHAHQDAPRHYGATHP